jgi:hypothetical protein
MFLFEDGGKTKTQKKSNTMMPTCTLPVPTPPIILVRHYLSGLF